MDLGENIWLSSFMDLPLYRLELSGVVEEENAIPFSGSYDNGIIVIHDIAEGIEGTAELLLLQKIMQAVNVSLSNAGLINIHKWENASIQRLVDTLSPQTIICFGGAMPNDQNLPELYQIGTLLNARALMSESLSLINSDVNKKKSLWLALKSLFILNGN